MKKLLASGLGGGLDIINASLLYFAAKNEEVPIVLGSVRPAPLEALTGRLRFSYSGAWVNKDTKINYSGRYIEPRVASLLEEEIMFFSRKYEKRSDPFYLRTAIRHAKSWYGLTDMIFVDGGGDSMILTQQDADGTAESIDPFYGGDAEALTALDKVPNTYLAVVSVGLDVSEKGFQKNIKLLKKRDAYFGKVNLVTREKQDYQLEHLLEFKEGFLAPFFDLAENTLVLTEDDFDNPDKMKSHTAVVTYHALKGNFGLKRTYVDWEPVTDGRKGVIVKPEHCWMYFFDAQQIHKLKLELNS